MCDLMRVLHANRWTALLIKLCTCSLQSICSRTCREAYVGDLLYQIPDVFGFHINMYKHSMCRNAVPGNI